MGAIMNKSKLLLLIFDDCSEEEVKASCVQWGVTSCVRVKGELVLVAVSLNEFQLDLQFEIGNKKPKKILVIKEEEAELHRILETTPLKRPLNKEWDSGEVRKIQKNLMEDFENSENTPGVKSQPDSTQHLDSLTGTPLTVLNKVSNTQSPLTPSTPLKPLNIDKTVSNIEIKKLRVCKADKLINI